MTDPIMAGVGVAFMGILTLLNLSNAVLLASVGSPWCAFAAGAAVFTAWVATVWVRKMR